VASPRAIILLFFLKKKIKSKLKKIKKYKGWPAHLLWGWLTTPVQHKGGFGHPRRSGVAEATPWPLGGGSATPKGQTHFFKREN
jgi:hypothetical protein